MAGGSPAPYQQEDSVSHTNPTYDEAEDGVVDLAEMAENADALGGEPPSNYETPNSTVSESLTGGYSNEGSFEVTSDDGTERVSVYGHSDAVRVNITDIDADEVRWSEVRVVRDGNVETVARRDNGALQGDFSHGYDYVEHYEYAASLSTGTSTFATMSGDIESHTPRLRNHNHSI